MELYPAIVGVFTGVNVDIIVATPQGCIVDIEMDTSNAKLMVFQTGKGSYSMFIHGGTNNEMFLSTGSRLTEFCTVQQCKDDAMVWNINTFAGLLQYRIKFPDADTVERFTTLANLWERSRERSTVDTRDIESALKRHVSTLAACQWEDDDVAFTEIDMLTATFALFENWC